MDELKAPTPKPPQHQSNDGSVVSPTKPFCGDPRDPRAQDTPLSTQRKRFEITSRGIDDSLQGRSGDPYGGTSWTGLRVPAFVNSPSTRYLFQLAMFQLSEGARARIVGMRQGYSLGFRQANTRAVEQWVEDPLFKLPDGNISWHLRKMPIGFPFLPRPGTFSPAIGFPSPLQSFQFEVSDTSALLYQAAAFGAPTGFYTSLSSYTPPNRGMPWGEPIGGDLGTFFDLKSKWQSGNDWTALDVPVEGPCNIAFYCSVLQTNPATRPPLLPPVDAVSPPNTVLNFSSGLSPEEQFLLNFPTANIWRVAGSLVIEMEDYKP